MAFSRASAPPVSAMVGLPPGRFTTPMSRQKTPWLSPVPKRLGAGLLGGETLGIGRGAGGAALGFGALGVGEDAGDETLADAARGFFQCGGCRRGRSPDPMIIWRASSISARIFWIDSDQAGKDRLADQEMADIEFADFRDGGDGLDIVVRSGRGRHEFQAR